MSSLSGGGNEPYGSGSYRHFEFGMGFEMVPLEGVESGADVMTKSTGTFGSGIGFKGELDYAPLHHPWFTLGGYGEFMSGGVALAGGTSYVLDVDGGLFGSIGPEAGTSLTLRAGLGFRISGSTSDTGAGIIDATTIASDMYAYQKVRAGLRWCASEETSDKDFCASSLEARVGTDLLGSLGSPIVVGLEYDNKRFLNIGAEFGFSYPRDTTAASTTTMAFDDKGFMLGFHISWSWDHFGGAQPPEPASTSSTQPDEPAAGSDADSATTRPDEHAAQQPARTAAVQPQPDATAQTPMLPLLAHERHRFGLSAAVPISCESLHGDQANLDYGGCGAGLRVAGDTPIGGLHLDLLGAGTGSTGVRFGFDIGSTFKPITGPFAYALRGTADFSFYSYDVTGVPCMTTVSQGCPTGPMGEAKGTIELLEFGAMALGSYTLGALSLEGGAGGGYSMVTRDRDLGQPYQLGRGDGYFVRFLVGARL